jgi:tRNA1(Val) A37 N6-methylase TrmN6
MNSPDFIPPKNSVTTHLLGGAIIVHQAAKGYRVGMDGAILAAVCAHIAQQGQSKTVIELGCGGGGALLSLKARNPSLRLTGLERDAVAVALAQKNIMANDFDDVSVIAFDIADGFAKSGLVRADMVMANPPYFDDEGAMRPVSAEKRGAWIADDGLGAWLDFAVAAVRDGGDIVFIHRADRLADILVGLSPKCGSFQLLPIQPFADQPAKRVVVMAKRLGKAPLRLLPALILHDEGVRKHRPEVEAILRGAPFDMGRTY